MRKFNLLFFVSGLLVVTGCGSINVDYIGKTFNPTKSVQLFFKGENINKPYNVMGKVIVKAPDTFTGQEIQKKIIKTAEEKGADAVLIDLYTQIPQGSSCFNNYPYYGYGTGYNCNPYWENACWGGGDSVQYYYQILIKAEFLRYKMQTSKYSIENNNQNSQIIKIGGQNEKTEY
jgi:hypothetical protein